MMRKIYNAITAAIGIFLVATTTVTAHAASLETVVTDYQPPIDTGGLQIVELLPHSRSCSPVDSDALCNDYVKLFNGSKTPVNLADYRLRTSYGGLSSSSRNTVMLSGILDPNQYEIVNERDDGSSLSLTQSGGYVWLEDAGGMQAYDPVIEYPDASANSKVSESWAFDGENWRWTASPQPYGPNEFPLEDAPETAPPVQTAPGYKPCISGQVRSPTTHRCHKINQGIKTVTPCKTGQTRNPFTKRCRLTKSITNTQASCKPGKVRNPATGRCRSMALSTKTKKSCKAGQERNPETGRCRKIQPKITPVHDIKTASKTNGQTQYLFFAIVLGACLYVIYEWREEIITRLGSSKAKLRFWRRQSVQNLVK